ncbi:hypothetical protein, partial [Shewanella sp. CG12_big_fil_rev_8_21_14_0_65_47_15]|uniref:hypothetical protein n=1 Tax=Shewanella sp. CG12_big_fil_rev_8_21_14_0_65_47_15 TaxID=1975537 RepID=UPI000CC051D0
ESKLLNSTSLASLLSLSAVSVDAHYREIEKVRKGFLNEKRSHGDLLNNNDSFLCKVPINWAFHGLYQ